MANERLGVRGTFAIYDATLRLLGGANTTGALTAGVAFHAFEANPNIQGSMKTTAVLFLAGVLMFTIAYIGWFTTIFYIDFTMREIGEPAPEDLWFPRVKTFEQNRKDARIGFLVMVLAGLASFALFMFGLGQVLLLGLTV
jgi:hypothetical protein